MKIEMCLGGGVIWNDEDKGMLAAVLGTRAFNYSILSYITNERNWDHHRHQWLEREIDQRSESISERRSHASEWVARRSVLEINSPEMVATGDSKIFQKLWQPVIHDPPSGSNFDYLTRKNRYALLKKL
ncbi:hypothetical protein TorRG33x02_058300 [Trema orientale]|uniref:Uncharacterized protein n=1 Tax=Trema orientale TaxID=63057 RepID=A0A2P5FKC6_TREOI|nr:hypothetical protein TorRG33x02_058300 [Trema orientale]